MQTKLINLQLQMKFVMAISAESEKGWVKKGERTDKRWKIGKHVSYLCLILSILNSVGGDGGGGGKIFLDPPHQKKTWFMNTLRLKALQIYIFDFS